LRARTRAVRAARPDLRPLRAPALVRPGPALAPLPRLPVAGRARRDGARRRLQDGRSRAGARPADGLLGCRRRPEPGDARSGPRADRRGADQDGADPAGRGLRARAAVRGRVLRRTDSRVPAALHRRPAGRPRRARARAPARRDRRVARLLRSPVLPRPAGLDRLRRRRPPHARPRDLAGLARGRWLPRREHPPLRRRVAAGAPARGLPRGRLREPEPAPPQPRRLPRRLGQERVSEARPAFYALSPGSWRDYLTLLHPPYTAWHLSFVAIGACLAPHVYTDRLGAAVAAFFLGLGVGAHALDELQGRPLATRIPDGILLALTVTSLAGAVAIGIGGALAFNGWLLVFVAVGAVL